MQAPGWYSRFVSDYGTTFGTTDEFAGVMLRVWWPAFAAAGFVESDFREALAKLVIAPNVPNWPREHLAAVNRELRNAQAARTAKPKEVQGYTGPRCSWCEWTGSVVVPHPEDVKGGRWVAPYRTGAVCCTRCGPGMRQYDAMCESATIAKRDKPLTLDIYEGRFDAAWAEHLEERAQAGRLMRQAENATEAIPAASVKRLTAMVAASSALPRKSR